MENNTPVPFAPPQQAPVIITQRGGSATTIGVIVGVGVLGFAAYKGHRWHVNKKQLEAGKLVNTDPNYRAAAAVQSATAGWYAVRNWDGSNTDTIIRVSAGATDYAKMVEAYKELTGDDLEKLLREKLSTSDYEKFQNSWKFRSDAPESTKAKEWKVQVKKGDSVWADKETNIRKTPVVINPTAAAQKLLLNPIFAAFSDKMIAELKQKNNILRKAPQGGWLGRATGRTSFDPSGGQGVLFVEIMAPAIKDPNSKTDKVDLVAVWVAASQIRTESWEAAKTKLNKNNMVYLYKPYYESLSGPGKKYEIWSRFNTHGYTASGMRLQVPGGLILGELRRVEGNEVHIKTIDGVLMKVPKPDIEMRLAQTP